MITAKWGLRLVKEGTVTYKLNSSEQAKELAKKYLQDLAQEKLILILLNHQNEVIGMSDVFSGTSCECMVEPSHIFRTILMSGATNFVLAHNHPSGDTRTSRADIESTKKILQGAKLLNLKFIDHIIVCGDKVVSMAEEGEIF